MRALWNARISALVLGYLVLITAVATGQGRGTTGGNPEAKKLKNPIAATPKAIEAGQKTYQKFCAFCHAADGKGNGPMAPKDSHPPNLIDDEWTHGSSDGEIFTVISDGAGPTSVMKPFKAKLTPEEIWNVVIYLHTLAKAH